MKIKYIIILSVLAVAFAAASLWVFLSGGKNAKAVKTKFRLGGLMLTVSGMLSLTSCEGGLGGEVMCYDPGPPQFVQFSALDKSGIVKVGDPIGVTIKDSPFKSHSYKLLVKGVDVIQSGELGDGDGSFQITIEPTDYRGDVLLNIFGIEEGKEFGIGAYLLHLE